MFQRIVVFYYTYVNNFFKNLHRCSYMKEINFEISQSSQLFFYVRYFNKNVFKIQITFKEIVRFRLKKTSVMISQETSVRINKSKFTFLLLFYFCDVQNIENKCVNFYVVKHEKYKYLDQILICSFLQAGNKSVHENL